MPNKKKVNTKKTVRPVKKAPVVEKAPIVEKTIPLPVVPEDKKQKEKVYVISKTFLFTIVAMIVILYAELIAGFVVYCNYDVEIRSKEEIARQERRLKNEALKRRKAEYRRMIEKRRAARQAALREAVQHRPPLAVATTENKMAPAIKTPKAVAPQAQEQKPAFKCPEPVARKVTFNEAEYAPYANEGSAVISGSTCVELNDGTKKCFEDVNVFINPVTSYSNEWYDRGWAGKENLARADERAFKFNKMVKSGKNGAFKFEKLKPGAYYVAFGACVPEGKDKPGCQPSRYAAKVKMKHAVKPTFKRVYP